MLGDFIALFFPQCCASCSGILIKGEKHICSSCHFHLPFISFEEAESDLKTRFLGRVETEYAFACLKFIKGGIAGKVLHALKYEGQTELGTWLGGMLGAVIRDQGLKDEFDAVVPVPAHRRRLRSRGYNQCDFPAGAIAEVIEKEVLISVAARIKYTESFTKKDRRERNQSLGGAFQVLHPEKLQGKHLLIVDDVVTTGSTIEALASCLKEAGATRISVATLAVAV